MKAKIEEANQEAVSRIQKARPELVDVSIAGEAIPGMKRNLILHAGPPVTWEKMCGPMKGAVDRGPDSGGACEEQAGCRSPRRFRRRPL